MFFCQTSRRIVLKHLKRLTKKKSRDFFGGRRQTVPLYPGLNAEARICALETLIPEQSVPWASLDSPTKALQTSILNRVTQQVPENLAQTNARLAEQLEPDDLVAVVHPVISDPSILWQRLVDLPGQRRTFSPGNFVTQGPFRRCSSLFQPANAGQLPASRVLSRRGMALSQRLCRFHLPFLKTSATSFPAYRRHTPHTAVDEHLRPMSHPSARLLPARSDRPRKPPAGQLPHFPDNGLNDALPAGSPRDGS